MLEQVLISDTSDKSQNIDSLAGKILRLNDDGTIPSDNPFEELVCVYIRTSKPNRYCME